MFRTLGHQPWSASATPETDSAKAPLVEEKMMAAPLLDTYCIARDAGRRWESASLSLCSSSSDYIDDAECPTVAYMWFIEAKVIGHPPIPWSVEWLRRHMKPLASNCSCHPSFGFTVFRLLVLIPHPLLRTDCQDRQDGSEGEGTGHQAW